MGKVCQSIPSGSEDKDVPWQKAWRSDHGAGNPVNRDDIKGGVKTKNNNLPAIIPYNPPFLHVTTRLNAAFLSICSASTFHYLSFPKWD
jgi:hypothetical protein